MDTGATPALLLRNISKSFHNNRVLLDVNFGIQTGEVHALVGENGAGKSTLIKILSGAHARDDGAIEVFGQSIGAMTPKLSQALGIQVIYQEFNLVPTLSVAENISLGALPTGRTAVRWQQVRRNAEAVLKRLDLDLPVEAEVGRLSVAQQQLVEIAKALSRNARILIMDEPTSALSHKEADHLLKVVRQLRQEGLAVIYISHRLDEVLELADRVSVLRDGRMILTAPVGEITRARMIEAMVGRPMVESFPVKTNSIGPEVLRVEQLSRGQTVKPATFSVRAGEILGIAGLVGAGRTELVRLIFGADTPDGGKVLVNGHLQHIRNPQQGIRAGIGLLPEDRKRQGLVLDHSIAENTVLANLRSVQSGGLVRPNRIRTIAQRYVKALSTRCAGISQQVRLLSGGNQQKVVLAKWLHADPVVYIFDEPTRGIDVNAKAEIYQIILDLASRGKGVILVSSELPEVLGLSDRVLVMHDGRISAELSKAEATQEAVMHYATGGTHA